MPEELEGSPAPESADAKQALAELENEGAVTAETKVEEAPKVEAKVEEAPKEEEKTQRTPSMVETWKLKVAEDQKEAAIARAAELEAKIEELSKQKSPVTQEQRIEVQDDIQALAQESGVDAEFLTKFANTILAKAKPSDLEKTVQDLANEKKVAQELAEYSDQFEKKVAPLVREKYQASDEALSQLKEKLKGLAFSETYAKVPLDKIFKAEEDTFELHAPKKSSEGTGLRVRKNDVVDLDSDLDEDSFAQLPPEKVEQFIAKKSSEGWNTPR